jgi:hypothetical protein
VFHFDLPIHPHTGVQALGLTKRGAPIWPVMGGSQPHGDPSAPPADPPADPAPAPTPSDPPDRGFPENTPIAEMTDAQRANYFRFHDRRKSDTLKAYDGITPEQAKQYKEQADEARRRGLQPDERALEDARNAATEAAERAAAERWAPTLAQQVVERFLPGDDKKDQRTSLLELIDPMKFMTDGTFDTDGLVAKLSTLAPALGGGGSGNPPSQWGQFSSQPPKTSAREEGLAEARRRGFIKD